MSKHTPGPWKAVDNRTVRTVDETHKKGGLIIADVFGHSADNTKGNARLIAAAPELLAVCEEAKKEIYEAINQRENTLAITIHHLTEIIAKATK